MNLRPNTPEAPGNPHRGQNFTSASFMGQDPWAEDRRKAPGLRVEDIDYLLRQAYATGCQAGFSEAQERFAGIYDDGYAHGLRNARSEVVEALRKYETNMIFNVLLDKVAERRKVCATKREKENLKWVGDQIAKVADALDGLRDRFGGSA